MTDTTNTTQGAERRNRTIVLIVVAMVLLGALIAGAFMTLRGGEDSTTSSAETTTAYVDDSGAQDNLPQHSPGDETIVDNMALIVDGQHAPVIPTELTTTGALVPPQDVNLLGWYSRSTVPGSGDLGSTVITGHVNDVSQGTGFAALFPDLELGDTVDVMVNGAPVTYEVTEAPYHVAKGEEFPPVINDTDNPNQLVLVTCGGEFVGGPLGYEDNIVVVASPVTV